ncbi:protocatechuate 3,4-dioxygenase beta subunit [Saccharopolyspora erythraea NRRL 2338]|uniref:Dioxygenase n=2 Tax=Saccharopolyspora erythraea TaxID=1836 RepID=A4FFD1_SACEN|nr:dioxygenase [Saccharopolyspora erythraea]PFG96477.1 protocatechuate 3,4-dioxygenase beta subunit [Saccharopolyspora erythraea NRRL 2338]QRK92971.1 dioxygenase [Saccharopolyspora erythraea]CAM02756.1 dioxygenase [Saccharopolyspora erythraea NRRL 2338]
MTEDDRKFRRSTFLKAGLATAAALPAVAGVLRPPKAGADRFDPTPRCEDGDEETPEQIEGPYFKPDSPQRTDMREPGIPGTALAVSGFAYSRSCTPLGQVLLDFWQADDTGVYDNTGYRLRGHQFTGADGRYRLDTIVPGLYPGRTRHIHVKVQAPNQPVLTTQLYFPGEPGNEHDQIFDPRLLMEVQDGPSGRAATFDFVLDLP